jgi:dimethylhistidine N-methyltransferase
MTFGTERPFDSAQDGPAATAEADARTIRQAFAADVFHALQRQPRQLPSKYFYDELGSALFEAICRLPWYRITRAETAMLAQHGPAIVAPFAGDLTLAELGCGSGDKLATFAAGSDRGFPLIQLIDISTAALAMACYRLLAVGFDAILAHHAAYEEGLSRAATARSDDPMLVLFLGSNIGNFDPPVAHQMLVMIRRMLRPGDGLLLGSDLVKPERDLLLAYDDPLGVTAAFNRNLLRRINDELGGDFDLDGFAHRASWNAADRRVEAHLVSRWRQHVEIPLASLSLTLDEGEAIWTESSHKYEPAQVIADGRAAGFDEAEQWIDEEARFALTRFRVSA